MIDNNTKILLLENQDDLINYNKNTLTGADSEKNVDSGYFCREKIIDYWRIAIGQRRWDLDPISSSVAAFTTCGVYVYVW